MNRIHFLIPDQEKDYFKIVLVIIPVLYFQSECCTLKIRKKNIVSGQELNCC